MEITLNEYIDRVGLEFEGYWDQGVLNELCMTMGSEDNTISLNRRHGLFTDGSKSIKLRNPFSNNVNDGSLRSSIHRDLETYVGRELITFPMDQERLNECMMLMKVLWDEKAYVIDERVGLHVHVSLKNDNHYGVVTSEGFYDSFSEMFESKFKAVAKSRKANRYCRKNLRAGSGYEGLSKKSVMQEHFKRSSSSKYYYINYQIDSFKTLEFRAYGGKDATIDGLCKFIQETVDLIAQYIENTESKIESKVVADPKKKRDDLRFEYKRKNPKRTVVDLNMPLDGEFYPSPITGSTMRRNAFSWATETLTQPQLNTRDHTLVWEDDLEARRRARRQEQMEQLANEARHYANRTTIFESLDASPAEPHLQNLELDANGNLRLSSRRARQANVSRPIPTDDTPW